MAFSQREQAAAVKRRKKILKPFWSSHQVCQRVQQHQTNKQTNQPTNQPTNKPKKTKNKKQKNKKQKTKNKKQKNKKTKKQKTKNKKQTKNKKTEEEASIKQGKGTPEIYRTLPVTYTPLPLLEVERREWSGTIPNSTGNYHTKSLHLQ